MNRYIETFQTWNKMAQLYQDKFMGLQIYNSSYDAFCDSVTKPNPVVLELGCGPGNITKYLLSKRPDFLMEASDVAPAMIEIARQSVPKANFQVLDVRDISSLSKQYDGIVCGFCIPYLSVEDLNQFLSDCGALLCSGGVFYLSFVAGNPDQSGYQVGSSGDRVYFYYHDLEETIEKIKNQQFTILNKMKVSYQKSDKSNEMHSIIIAQKKFL